MSLRERITSVDELRSWKDQIPFHYEYTAGVAGEKFLRGLKEGKLVASRCRECGTEYLPPKAYCVECFAPIRDYKRLDGPGVVEAAAESKVAFDGSPLRESKFFVFVKFNGVTGGIIHIADRGLGIGMKAKPKFRPAGQRTGTILDIEAFVKA